MVPCFGGNTSTSWLRMDGARAHVTGGPHLIIFYVIGSFTPASLDDSAHRHWSAAHRRDQEDGVMKSARPV